MSSYRIKHTCVHMYTVWIIGTAGCWEGISGAQANTFIVHPYLKVTVHTLHYMHKQYTY